MSALRFHAQLDLRAAMDSMPFQDLFALIDSSLEREAQRTRTDENTAMLLDRWNFYLDGEYSGWITDPSDPDVQRAQKQRKAQGIVPPPRPVLFPVALRSAELTAKLRQRYAEEMARYSTPAAEREFSVADLMKMRGM